MMSRFPARLAEQADLTKVAKKRENANHEQTTVGTKQNDFTF
jgi:hypothetical protein